MQLCLTVPAFVGVFFVAACGEESYERSLKDLKPRALRLELADSNGDGLTPGAAAYGMPFVTLAFPAGRKAPCLSLSQKVKVTLDGQPFDVNDRGGYVNPDVIWAKDFSTSCAAAYFGMTGRDWSRFYFAPPTTTRLVIEDDTDRIELTFDGFFAQPPRIIEPTDGVLRRGQSATLVPDPSVPYGDKVAFGFLKIPWETSYLSWLAQGRKDESRPGAYTFDVPATAVLGEGYLTVYPGVEPIYTPQAPTTCVGAMLCDVVRSQRSSTRKVIIGEGQPTTVGSAAKSTQIPRVADTDFRVRSKSSRN